MMSKSERLALVMALVPFTLPACDAADGEWQGTVQDSAGIDIVTNTGNGVWSGSGWTVAQDLMIGTAEGDADYQFGQIAGIDVGADGRIYVIDQQAHQVRVFDPDGEFLMAMGKEGSGPGELSQAAGPVFVGPGDTVIVPDMMHQRITRFTAAGEPAGSHPLPMTGGMSARWMETPDQDLVQQAVIVQMPGQPDVEPRNLLLRRAPSGEVRDTLMELPVGRTFDFLSGRPNITMFESEPMWAMAPDGRLYFGVNSEYRLQVRSPGGELERIVAKEWERRPVTSSDQDEYRHIIEGLWRDGGLPPQAMEMMSQALSFADYYPAYANLLGGPDGTLWVQSIQTPDQVVEQGGAFDIQDMGGPDWEVFDSEGRLLGTVSMPPRFNPLLFHGDAIYGVLRDDLDVQYVARMRLEHGTLSG